MGKARDRRRAAIHYAAKQRVVEEELRRVEEEGAALRTSRHTLGDTGAPPRRFNGGRVHGVVEEEVILWRATHRRPKDLPAYTVESCTQQTYACYSRRPAGKEHVHTVGRATTLTMKVHTKGGADQ